MTTEEPEAPPVAEKSLDKLDSIIAKATRVQEWLAETGLGPKIADLVRQAWALRHDMQQEFGAMSQQGSGGQGGQPGPNPEREGEQRRQDILAHRRDRRDERQGPQPDNTLPGQGQPPDPTQLPADEEEATNR